VPVGLLIVLGLGVALRVAMSVAYRPAVLTLDDTSQYLAMADGELFSNPVHTAGYPLFLRTVHAVSDDLWLTIAVQHLLGLVTGVLLYAAVRGLGGPRWAAVVAAAAVVLSLDQVFLEHAIMTETLFTTCIVASVYAAVRSLDGDRRLWGRIPASLVWAAAAGIALGAAIQVRTFVVLLIPFMALWFALSIRAGVRARLTRAVVGGGAAVAMVLVYALASYSYSDHFGLSRAGGWALYSRTAQFADCSRFDPPAGTERLCESTPPASRPGPDAYGWGPTSPARELYGGPPEGGDELAAFARTAILHQPLDYVGTVVNDGIRYFAPGWNDRRGDAGPAYEVIDIDRRSPGSEEAILAALNVYYEDERARVRTGIVALSDVQQFFRVHPLLLLQALLLALFGLRWAGPRTRAGIALLGGTAIALMLIPVATAIYTARYAIPANGLLLGAGALGASAIIAARRSETVASSAPAGG